MSDTDTHRRLRAEVAEWVEQNLAAIDEDNDRTLRLPVLVDFFLVVAVEDAADSDSDTFYHFISSGCSHYRKVGLVSCAKRMLLRDDPDDD